MQFGLKRRPQIQYLRAQWSMRRWLPAKGARYSASTCCGRGSFRAAGRFKLRSSKTMHRKSSIRFGGALAAVTLCCAICTAQKFRSGASTSLSRLGI